MEITGKIIDILPAMTGQGQKGEWKKQLFILETVDQFPKKLCIESWNDKLTLAINPAQTVKVFFDIESREFNGKWYTNLKAWKMELVGANAPKPDEYPPHYEEYPGMPPMENDPDNDLPF
jgi:hypothetical protein